MNKIRLWNRWWFLPLNLLGLLLVAGWWWHITNSPLARLKASGAPTTYEELVTEPIPDAENVAAGLRDAYPLLAGGETRVADLLRFDDDGTLPADQLAEAEAILTDHAAALAMLREAIARPRYVSLVSVEDLEAQQGLIDSVGPLKSASRLLSLASQVAIQSEQPQATEDVLASLRLAKLIEAEPLITGRLVACALQSMAIRDATRLIEGIRLNKTDKERLDASLAQIEDRSSRVESLVSERVHTLELTNRMPFPGRLFLGTTDLLRGYEEQIARARDESQQPNGSDTGGTYAPLLLPSFQSLEAAEQRVAAEAGAARELLRAGADEQP